MYFENLLFSSNIHKNPLFWQYFFSWVDGNRQSLALRTLKEMLLHSYFTPSTHLSPAILIFRLASRSKFSAFRSRWTMFRQWQKKTAATICLNFRRASFSAILPWATRWSVMKNTVLILDTSIIPNGRCKEGYKGSTKWIS